ncbi:hypothetical protein [Ideonella alba]|uniref:DUF4304 domain-containing protein n=1 Tax=Ideonella alba TaxID=2824118 RepID=A0A940YJ32_9BURK|nr:hypothetical protein [Ideonella alba]MBQ0933500.1 hypothetical protein [Ideonella alba]
MPTYAAPGSPEKKLESRNAQKVMRLLSNKLKSLGFQRTKTSFFTRHKTLVIEFVHIHKYSFEPSFRVHFGIRVRTDTFPAAHLNGPSSDAIEDPQIPNRRLYNFSFDPNDASLEACAESMYQCALAEGASWFASMEKLELLLSPASPLTPEARAALQREVDSSSMVQVSDETRQVLNAA